MLSEPNKDSAPVAGAPAEPESLSVFKLQPDPPPANSLSVDELLRYHDRFFVENVYTAIARRNPTKSELATSLADLRTGDKSKIEIIEGVVAAQKAAGVAVVVAGLPSPALRKLGRWPVIGPFFRVLRGVTRLPVMMQNQQRFESYAIAQQQRLADFLNERVMPQLNLPQTNGGTELKTTVADVVESVMMLSDSVVELVAKQTELSEALLEEQVQLRRVSEHFEEVSSQLTTGEASQRKLAAKQTELSETLLEAQVQLTGVSETSEQVSSRLITVEVSQRELAATQTELSETLLEAQVQLTRVSETSEQVSSRLTTVEVSQRELQSQAEKLAREPEQLQTQITSLVEQLSSLVELQHQSETLFRRDLVNLTQAIQALQEQFEEFPKRIEALNSQTSEHATSQREFLIQEQQLIVETQKVVFNELQTQLTESEQRTQASLNSLTDIVQQLREAKEVE